MGINKKIIASFFVVSAIFCGAFVSNASVIYKDINSISIRTNFNFDYESIKNDGVPELTFENLDEEGESNNEAMIYTLKSAKYVIESCEWYNTDDRSFNIGGTPRVAVYLVTKDYGDVNPDYNSSGYSGDNDYYYRFLSSYSSSTCYITKGTFISATRNSTSNLKVIFELQPLKGTFNPPENAYWEDDRGHAHWDSPNICDSGCYDLVLYRESTIVARVDKYKGNSYNFAANFTKEGDYSFKVRTVAGTENQATYGKNSEYTESGATMVDATIIQSIIAGGGTGDINNSGSTNVGWIQLNNIWYFYRPDGSMVRNGWVSWQSNWYYMDEKGEMKTGVQTVNGRTYYLGADGAMATGWININDTYYYFDTTQGDNYGALLVNSWIKYENKYFYFDENGVMVTGWKQIPDGSGNTGYYYFYPKGTTQGLYGYMAANTTINGFQIGADGKWIQR